MQRLSSRWTPFGKFVLPGGPAIFLPWLYLHCFEDKAFSVGGIHSGPAQIRLPAPRPPSWGTPFLRSAMLCRRRAH
jgi:hypothetical protein